MKLKHALVEFTKTEDVNEESGIFEGYGSVFGNIDLGGDVVKGGAFAKSLMDWAQLGQLPQMLGFHQSSNVIGDWLEMREDEKGLYVKGQLWVKGSNALEESKKAYNMLKGTGPKGLSIGYTVEKEEQVEFSGGFITNLIEIKLYEVSVVGFAMNPQAFATGVKSMVNDDGKILSKRDMEKFLRESGLSKTKSQAFLAGGYDAISGDQNSGKDIDQRDSDPALVSVLESLKSISHNYRR